MSRIGDYYMNQKIPEINTIGNGISFLEIDIEKLNIIYQKYITHSDNCIFKVLWSS